MGHYGTTLRTFDGTVYIDSIANAKSEYQIDEKIDETNANINKIKSRMLQLVTCTPKDVFTADAEEDVLHKITEEFENGWEWLEEEMSQNVEASLAKRIVEDWKYSDKNAKFNELISPQEKYDESVRTLKEIEDSDKDTSIDGIFDRAKKSMSLNSYNDRYKIKEKYAAFFDGELYVDLYGNWLWDSVEEAAKKAMSAINVSSPWRLDKEYVNDNKEFILSLASFIDWQKIISDKGNTFYKQCESPEEYNALVEKIINGDAESMDTMVLSSTMSNAYNNIVRSHIEIRRVI